MKILEVLLGIPAFLIIWRVLEGPRR